jgi:hypothetical protein
MSKGPIHAEYVVSGQFTAENCALILIDHQVGTLQSSGMHGGSFPAHRNPWSRFPHGQGVEGLSQKG